MTNEVLHATFRIYKCPKGGFVLAQLFDKEDEHGRVAMEQEMRQATGDRDQCIGALARAVAEWDDETERVAKAQEIDTATDQPKVIKPPRFWWRKAVTR